MPQDSDYETSKGLAYKNYKETQQIYCPYLKTKISFSSDGFRHLVYKGGGKKRDEESQLMRFTLLEKAREVLSITTTLQEYQSESREMLVEEHEQKVSKIVTVVYFGFIAIIENWKFKVIVKQIGKGRPFFWSVIPNWRTRNKERIMFKGNLEEG
ncbi:MAG: hypothetical protein NT141_03990 [candidate division WWE3 bacterium]|nr:hypothetical protein [candidate division WWE3 bacterium]